MRTRTLLALCALLLCAMRGFAQDPPELADCPSQPPKNSAPQTDPGTTGASGQPYLASKDVIDILDRAVAWYRTLGIQEQFADQPSDQLILYANQRIADQVVALAFQIARANAELYSSAVGARAADAGAPSPLALSQERDRLSAAAEALARQIAAEKAQRPAAKQAQEERAARIAADEGNLDVIKARANLIGSMVDFADQNNSQTSKAKTLKAQIDAIASSIPAAANPASSGAGTAKTAGAAAAASDKQREAAASGRTGLWDLATAVWRAHDKIATIARLRDISTQLTEVFSKHTATSHEQLLRFTKCSDALATLASQSQHSNAQEQEAVRNRFDTLAWFFNQTSSIYLPLANEQVLLKQYIGNLENWKKDADAQYQDAWIALLKRLGIVLAILMGIFAVGEAWRRAVVRLAHDRSRLYQLLLVRKVVLWVAVIAVLGLSVVTEISTFATFAGLLTAGIAVAMQSVLVSVVGYFFLIGKYGVRVGDRVQIGNVVGEVMDIGLVRMHLMEYHPSGPLGPTGRVVAFANLIVFQASGGLFKQLSGTHFIWHEMTVALPPTEDYAALKGRLLEAVAAVVERHRPQFGPALAADGPRATPAVDEAKTQVQMHYADGHMEALIRYPVTLDCAAEIDEEVAAALLKILPK